MVDSKQDFRDALTSLDRIRAEALFVSALAEASSPLDVVEHLIVPTLQDLGDDWQAGKIALSQIYMSSRVCEELVGRALPAGPMVAAGPPRQAIVVLNDYHMLGKRIVGAVLRASGLAVLDYGRMDVATLVERTIADRLDLLLISTLMLPSALKIREVRNALDARGIRVRIAVGGAPFLFDPELWREVGADAMGQSAADAIRIVRTWTETAA